MERPSEAGIVMWLKVFEKGNFKLKQLVADLSLDKQMLQDVLPKSPEARSNAAPDGLPSGRLRRQ